MFSITIDPAAREYHGNATGSCASHKTPTDPKWALQQAQKTKRYRTRSTDELQAARTQAHPDGFKKCRSCGPQPLASFAANRSMWDNCQMSCRNCDTRRKSFSRQLKATGAACEYCGLQHSKMTLDHIWPLALGGKNEAWNLAFAGEECNQAKRDMSPFAFFAMVGIDAKQWVSRIGLTPAGPVAVAA